MPKTVLYVHLPSFPQQPIVVRMKWAKQFSGSHKREREPHPGPERSGSHGVRGGARADWPMAPPHFPTSCGKKRAAGK